MTQISQNFLMLSTTLLMGGSTFSDTCSPVTFTELICTIYKIYLSQKSYGFLPN